MRETVRGDYDCGWPVCVRSHGGARLRLYRSTIVHSGRVQWWVAEGDIFNSRIPLNSLSDAARKELAYDFGLSFAEGEARSPIAEQKPIRKAAAVEGLIHWMEENRGFAKQRGGDDKLKPDWASMIECWKFTREIRSNLRRNLRRRGIDDKHAIWHKLVRLELR